MINSLIQAVLVTKQMLSIRCCRKGFLGGLSLVEILNRLFLLGFSLLKLAFN